MISRKTRFVLVIVGAVLATSLAAIWMLSLSPSVVRCPTGPIAAITLPAGFTLRGEPDLPHSLVALGDNSRRFQILTVDTEEAGADNGPLSRQHIERIEHPRPDFREDVEINGFSWSLEVSSGSLSQLLAIAQADGVTIGIIGTGDWTLDAALTVLQGIERRQQ